MDQDQRLFAIGCFINGALFLIGAFTMGALHHNDTVMLMALASAAAGFFAYVFQIFRMPYVGWGFTLTSWAGAALAFFAMW